MNNSFVDYDDLRNFDEASSETPEIYNTNFNNEMMNIETRSPDQIGRENQSDGIRPTQMDAPNRTEPKPAPEIIYISDDDDDDRDLESVPSRTATPPLILSDAPYSLIPHLQSPSRPISSKLAEKEESVSPTIEPIPDLTDHNSDSYLDLSYVDDDGPSQSVITLNLLTSPSPSPPAENVNIRKSNRLKDKGIPFYGACGKHNQFLNLAFHAEATTEDKITPHHFNQAMQCPEKQEWSEACQREIDAHMKNNTWTLVPCPKDKEDRKKHIIMCSLWCF